MWVRFPREREHVVIQPGVGLRLCNTDKGWRDKTAIETEKKKKKDQREKRERKESTGPKMLRKGSFPNKAEESTMLNAPEA